MLPNIPAFAVQEHDPAKMRSFDHGYAVTSHSRSASRISQDFLKETVR
jgi:hypothetical protein